VTYLLWQAQGDARIASPRRVLRAAEVPLLRDAQQLCERLSELERDASQRVEAAEAQARERGHAEGLAAGAAVARDETAAVLGSIARAAAAERARLREQVGSLALQVARKMLGGFATDERLAALAAAAALDMLPATQVTLAVHPDQCDAVRERLAELDADDLRLDVRADPACAPDACRLETEHGCVDASLDAQLARLAQAWGLATENA
jgi:type III secretion protein L